jgi:hypothetical protein
VTTGSERSTAPGCRETAFSTLLLLGLASVFFIVGLSLVGQDDCTGACQTLALTLLYAGGPVSAVFGVVFGSLVMAWPLDITFWVVAAFVSTRLATIRDRRPLAVALVLIALALAYGLVLSRLVEIAV